MIEVPRLAGLFADFIGEIVSSWTKCVVDSVFAPKRDSIKLDLFSSIRLAIGILAALS